ncbi:MAG: response regulator transcription factor [Candidatus Sulfotelmatobacter sp.]
MVADRLLSDIIAMALSKYGWRLVAPGTETTESESVDLALIYCFRPLTAIAEDVQIVRDKFRNAKIILLGARIPDEDLLRLIRAGAGAYVDTSQGLTELLDAFNMVRENRSPPRGRVTWLVLEYINRLARHRHSQSDLKLTFRQKQNLNLVAKGLSNKEIAGSLSITPNTVKNHVHNLLEKMNLRSRHEAAWIKIGA